MCVGSKDLGIRLEAHLRAPPVGSATELFQLAFGLAALEHHAVQRLLASDFDFHAR